MKIGLNQGCIVLSSDLETDLLLAESAGFDYLELRTDRIRSYLQKHTLEDLRTFFDSHHLKPHAIGGTYVYREFLSSMDNPEQQEALLKDIRFAFEAGRAVGSDCIIVVPPMNPEVQGEIPYGYSFDDTLNLFPPMLQKLSDLADGATYALTVENEERHIFIGYRITEGYTHMGLMWKKDIHAELLPAIDVNDTEALAFDHAYILNTALDRLEEMQKEYREQLE